MDKYWFVWVLIIVIYECLLGTTKIGVEGYPIEDLVVNLPGQPKVNFNQYAGYVDIDVKHGRSLFYYFAEAQHHPDKNPLTLWLNGGPGCSSIGGGAFTELGPFYPSSDGHGLVRNSKSWNRVSNLLFVESPAGVGWSYSNTSSDYTHDDTSTANDLVLFLLKWFEKFPSYKSRDLFLTGESYGGHYIPQLTNALIDYNIHSTHFKFNIKGVAIGNPLLKLDRDTQATYDYFWSHGMISDENGLTIKKECNFDDFTWASPNNVSKACQVALDDSYKIVSEYIDNYDVILDVCYSSNLQQQLRLKKIITKTIASVDVCIGEKNYVYLNRPEVQKALHANRTNLKYPWSMCSDFLNYSNTDPNLNMLPILKRIVQNQIPVWIYSGDQDSVVPLLGTRSLIRELAHDLKFKITDPYRVWIQNGQVGGWVTEYGKLLTFATVRGAGHMVPYAQPARSLQLFKSFVRGRKLPRANKQSN